jgi:type I restriction enzyme S subunit
MDALADGLGGLNMTLEKPATELAAGNYSYFAEGDLLIAKVTPCFENGKKALVKGLPNRIGFATSEVHVVRPDRKRIDPNFLRYLLSSETFRAAGIASMTGAGGLRRISDNAIKDFALPIVDLENQKVIAAFLDRETARIDQLIEKKERQIGLLIDRKTSSIHQQVRRGIDGNNRFKDTGNPWFPSVPEHWEPMRVRYLYRPVKRQGMMDLDVLSVYREYGVILKSSRDDNINKTPEDLSSYQLVEQNDLVINKMKAWQGSLGVSSLHGITSPDYLVYTPLRLSGSIHASLFARTAHARSVPKHFKWHPNRSVETRARAIRKHCGLAAAGG